MQSDEPTESVHPMPHSCTPRLLLPPDRIMAGHVTGKTVTPKPIGGLSPDDAPINGGKQQCLIVLIGHVTKATRTLMQIVARTTLAKDRSTKPAQGAVTLQRDDLYAT